MEHQKCRLCGNRHSLGPCPAFKSKQLKEALVVAEKKAKPTFDRKAYQKEYMRGYMRKQRMKQRSGG